MDFHQRSHKLQDGQCDVYTMKKIFCFFLFPAVILPTAFVVDGRFEEASASIGLFDNKKDFQIVNARRGITKQSSAMDTLMCRGWGITVENLRTIIRACRTTEQMDWHHEFDVLPCIIHGTIRQDGQDFPFEVNAGSWVYVRCKSKTIILGCYDKRYEQYFVSHAWTGEED
jgi:hypothetical protein